MKSTKNPSLCSSQMGERPAMDGKFFNLQGTITSDGEHKVPTLSLQPKWALSLRFLSLPPFLWRDLGAAAVPLSSSIPMLQ